MATTLTKLTRILFPVVNLNVVSSRGYRKVKRYTFGMGAVGQTIFKRPGTNYYERQTKPVRRGVTAGHRIFNYENLYKWDSGYEARYYKGGPKPRFNSDEKELMEQYLIKNPPYDEWDETHALFGQNDYIDILGDGNVSVRELNVDAPFWLRGWSGTRLHHIQRQLHFEEDYLINARPTKWWKLRKEMTRLYRNTNRYRKRNHQRQPLN